MGLIEAAQQALEALERADNISGYGNNRKAIAALRAALAEDVAETNFGNIAQGADSTGADQSEDVLGMVEPVAWMWQYRRLDGCVVRVTTYRSQHPPKELDFILKNLGEDAIPLYAENPPRNIHPKTGVTACLMQSPEFRLTPWSEK